MNTPLRFVSILLCLFALIFSGCAAQQVQAQRVVASTFAVASNRAGDVLASTYRFEGLKAIAEAKTRSEAEDGLAKVRAKWAPLWTQWENVRKAQDAWATALDSGASIEDVNHAARQLQNTYCVLVDLAKPLAFLPASPGVTCPVVQ